MSLPQAGRAVTLALVAFLILGCRGGATPGPQLTANMVGDPAAEGSISAYPRSDGRAELSGFLGSGGDWGATIRSGTCEEPGPIEHIVGPVENGTIYAVVDEPFSALAGKIIVMTPLGSNRQASCGVLGGS